MASREREELKERRLQQLRRAVDAGFEEIGRGDATEHTSATAIADAVKLEGRRRIAKPRAPRIGSSSL